MSGYTTLDASGYEVEGPPKRRTIKALERELRIVYDEVAAEFARAEAAEDQRDALARRVEALEGLLESIKEHFEYNQGEWPSDRMSGSEFIEQIAALLAPPATAPTPGGAP